MAIRLGLGEYAKVEFEARDSTWDARQRFLKVLYSRNARCFNDLVQFYDSDKLPDAFLMAEKKSQGIIKWFVLSRLGDEQLRNEMKYLLDDTPLFLFLNFVSAQKRLDENAWLNDPSIIARTSRYDIELKLKTVIPDWSELKKKATAEMFCQSVETWARGQNLHEEWFLDYIVIFFRNLFYLLEMETFNFAKTYVEKHNQSFFCFTYLYEDNVRTSLRGANFDFYSKADSYFSDVQEFQPKSAFEYKCEHFRLPKITWYPHLFTRKQFENDARNILKRHKMWLSQQKELFPFQNPAALENYLEQSRNRIESYCDYVEKAIAEGENESRLTPLVFGDLICAIWSPAELNRTEFVEEILTDLKKEILDLNNQLKSYEKFKQTDFEKKLKAYCEITEKPFLDSSKWRKTPRINSDQLHFEWLVDYQMNPNKSLESIAQQNSVDRKRFGEGIKAVAKMIGLTLREHNRTGRPKGAKTINTTYHRASR